MVVRLHPEALAEYGEAVGFYEERVPGLGREFFDEVQRVLRVIGDNPGLGSSFDGPYRRAYRRRFPLESSILRMTRVSWCRRSCTFAAAPDTGSREGSRAWARAR